MLKKYFCISSDKGPIQYLRLLICTYIGFSVKYCQIHSCKLCIMEYTNKCNCNKQVLLETTLYLMSNQYEHAIFLIYNIHTTYICKPKNIKNMIKICYSFSFKIHGTLVPHRFGIAQVICTSYIVPLLSSSNLNACMHTIKVQKLERLKTGYNTHQGYNFSATHKFNKQ